MKNRKLKDPRKKPPNRILTRKEKDKYYEEEPDTLNKQLILFLPETAPLPETENHDRIRPIKCEECNGLGEIYPDRQDWCICPRCFGRGIINNF